MPLLSVVISTPRESGLGCLSRSLVSRVDCQVCLAGASCWGGGVNQALSTGLSNAVALLLTISKMKVARMVDEKGAAVIMKNNRPRYLILNFDTLEDGTAGDEEVEAISKKLMQQNRTAYEVLAK